MGSELNNKHIREDKALDDRTSSLFDFWIKVCMGRFLCTAFDCDRCSNIDIVTSIQRITNI
jgi:hypothetical protein